MPVSEFESSDDLKDAFLKTKGKLRKIHSSKFGPVENLRKIELPHFLLATEISRLSRSSFQIDNFDYSLRGNSALTGVHPLLSKDEQTRKVALEVLSSTLLSDEPGKGVLPSINADLSSPQWSIAVDKEINLAMSGPYSKLLALVEDLSTSDSSAENRKLAKDIERRFKNRLKGLQASGDFSWGLLGERVTRSSKTIQGVWNNQRERSRLPSASDSGVKQDPVISAFEGLEKSAEELVGAPAAPLCHLLLKRAMNN